MVSDIPLEDAPAGVLHHVFGGRVVHAIVLHATKLVRRECVELVHEVAVPAVRAAEDAVTAGASVRETGLVSILAAVPTIPCEMGLALPVVFRHGSWMVPNDVSCGRQTSICDEVRIDRVAKLNDGLLYCLEELFRQQWLSVQGTSERSGNGLAPTRAAAARW